MIGYFIISKSFIPLVVYLGAVMDAPWGPHFGITLKVNSNPDDILLRVLGQPSMPRIFMDMLKTKPMVKQEKLDDKSRRQQARDEDIAREVLVQSENKMEWCELFVAAPLVETKFVDTDPLQQKMVDYAKTMGGPTEGNALTDNFGRWS